MAYATERGIVTTKRGEKSCDGVTGVGVARPGRDEGSPSLCRSRGGEADSRKQRSARWTRVAFRMASWLNRSRMGDWVSSNSRLCREKLVSILPCVQALQPGSEYGNQHIDLMSLSGYENPPIPSSDSLRIGSQSSSGSSSRTVGYKIETTASSCLPKSRIVAQQHGDQIVGKPRPRSRG
ncbi:unnamed protein product [Sphagnum balticum]